MPFPLDTAVRAGEIEVGAAEPNPFAARELCRVLSINALFAKIIVRRCHVRNIHPCDIQNLAYRQRFVCPREEVLDAAFPVARIRALHIANFECLKAAAFSEFRLLLRDEPIEEPIVPVLSLVDNARSRVDSDCLMVEPSHRLEWDRRGESHRSRDWHLKVVAVVLLICLLRLLDSLLAGYPRLPRCQAAGTVADGACEA